MPSLQPTRFTRSCLLLFTACVLVVSVTGCGMSEEDRDFYLNGWVKPTDLDKPSHAELRRRQSLDESVSSQAAAPARDAMPATNF